MEPWTSLNMDLFSLNMDTEEGILSDPNVEQYLCWDRVWAYMALTLWARRVVMIDSSQTQVLQEIPTSPKPTNADTSDTGEQS